MTSDNLKYNKTIEKIYNNKTSHELGDYINYLENINSKDYKHHRAKRLDPLKELYNEKKIMLETPDKDDTTPVITKHQQRFLLPKLDTPANLPKTSLGGGKRKTLHNKRKKNKQNRHRSTFSHSKRARSM